MGQSQLIRHSVFETCILLQKATEAYTVRLRSTMDLFVTMLPLFGKLRSWTLQCEKTKAIVEVQWAKKVPWVHNVYPYSISW